MSLAVTLSSDLFNDNRNQNVTVDNKLLVSDLIAEIQREYDLPAGDYLLYDRVHSPEPMPPEARLEDAGVRTGHKLTFVKVKYRTRAFLHCKNVTFEIKKPLTLIGRPHRQQDFILDIDLSDLDENNHSSRPHALLSAEDGKYYIQSLNSSNLTYVNDQPVHVRILRELSPNDKLRMGKASDALILIFTIDKRLEDAPAGLP